MRAPESLVSEGWALRAAGAGAGRLLAPGQPRAAGKAFPFGLLGLALIVWTLREYGALPLDFYISFIFMNVAFYFLLRFGAYWYGLLRKEAGMFDRQGVLYGARWQMEGFGRLLLLPAVRGLDL